MRTTVVLDDELVAKARKALGPKKTLRAMIEESLREAIRAKQRQAALDWMGTFDLAITEEELHEMRKDDVLE